MSAAESALPDSQSPQYNNAQAVDDSPASPTSDSGRGDLKWDPNVGDNQQQGATGGRDRRLSNEWDAAKTPPSRFQKRKGSIHATPASRDGHVERNKSIPVISKKWMPGIFGSKDK